MEEDIRWEQRFANFEKAFLSLKDVFEQKGIEEDIKIDVTIKRFELVFELAWKTLQYYLCAMGYMEYNDPGMVLAQSLQDHLIEDNDLWSAMHGDRNILFHVDDFDKSRSIFKHIERRYIIALEQLYKKLKDESTKRLRYQI